MQIKQFFIIWPRYGRKYGQTKVLHAFIMLESMKIHENGFIMLLSCWNLRIHENGFIMLESSNS